jgi:splicing factor 3A subunit 3
MGNKSSGIEIIKKYVPPPAQDPTHKFPVNLLEIGGGILDCIQDQSKRLREIYKDIDGARSKEVQEIPTCNPLKEFYEWLSDIKSFHTRYPNERVENLSRASKKKAPEEDVILDIDYMYTGEEAYSQFLDLGPLYELYINLPSIKHPTYLQYLDIFV